MGEPMEVDTFSCIVCSAQHSLGELCTALPCSCLACVPCMVAHAAAQLDRACKGAAAAQEQGGSMREYAKGQAVLYLARDGSRQRALVAMVDQSMLPPSYGIQLPGAPELRFTEGTRLVPADVDPQHLSAGVWAGC